MNLLGTLFVAYAACEAILLLLSIPLGVIWDTRRPTWLGFLVLVVVGGLAIAATAIMGIVMRRSRTRLRAEHAIASVLAAFVLVWILVDAIAIFLFGEPIPAAP